MSNPLRSRFRLAAATGALLLSSSLCLGSLTPVVAQAAPASVATVGSTAPRPITLDPQARQRLAELAPRLGFVDVDGEQCGPSVVDQWSEQFVARLTEADLNFLAQTGAAGVVSLDALLNSSADDPRYRLTLDAHDLTKAFQRLRAFWTPTRPDVQLTGVDPEVLRDPVRVAKVYEFLGAPADEAQALAEYVAQYYAASTTLQAASPAFSLGAFTVAPEVYPGLPDKIILGQGFVQAYADLGHEVVAGPFILAHEFGHVAQIAAGQWDTLPETMEQNRRLELMADAAAGYFSSHPKGLSRHNMRVDQFGETAWTAGSCNVDEPNHHGLPLQRRAAALFGSQLAEQGHPRSRVLTFEQFVAEFDRALPGILAAGA